MRNSYTLFMLAMVLVLSYQQCSQTADNDLLQSGKYNPTQEAHSSIMPIVAPIPDSISINFHLPILLPQAICK